MQFVSSTVVTIGMIYGCLYALPSAVLLANELPDAIIVRSDTIPAPVWSDGKKVWVTGWAGQVNKNNNQRSSVQQLFLRYEHVESRKSPNGRAKMFEYTVDYPVMHSGDIVPLLTGFYEVMGLSDSGKHSVGFRRVAPERFPGVTTRSEETMIFPMGVTNGSSLTNGKSLSALKFHVEKDGTSKQRDAVNESSVTIHFKARHNTAFGRSKLLSPARKQSVKVGGWVEFDKRKHRVMKIVDPDPKRQIIGWIELSIRTKEES